MKKNCLIISGGDYSPIGKKAEGRFVITCDRGYMYAKKEGIVPDLFIGDFDSFAGSVDGGVQVLTLPHEKDDTDTNFAVKYAYEHGAEDVLICCALGGRLDHMISNIQSCKNAAELGMKIRIEDESSRIYFVSESADIEKDEDYSLSVFALSDECTGVSIKGSYYELDDFCLKNNFPIGQSNEWGEGPVRVSVKSGVAAVVLSSMKKERSR